MYSVFEVRSFDPEIVLIREKARRRGGGQGRGRGRGVCSGVCVLFCLNGVCPFLPYGVIHFCLNGVPFFALMVCTPQWGVFCF